MPVSPQLSDTAVQPQKSGGRPGVNRRRRRLILAGLVAAAAGTTAAFGSSTVLQRLDGLLPDARGISAFSRPGTVTILSADGDVLQKLGPASREKIALGQMPELVKDAFIAAEDTRFYQHNGVDIVGIGRALVTNVSSGKVEQGASTITQQLARVVFLTQDRTLVRKAKEAALALKLERQLSKEQILNQYLNNVYLGSSAYGVADAAWVYFSKSVDQLTLPEAALIAGLPPAPSIYSPLVNPELALQRRAIVLRRMHEIRQIDAAQLAEAQNAPLDLKPALPKFWNSTAPYFTSWVAQELPRVLSPEQLEVGGLTIRSSLNADWQTIAKKVIKENTWGGQQGAVVSIEPGTGLVRTMIGGQDFSKSQFNRATQALRSPGSTFKLFDYTAAVAAGVKPEDIFIDQAQCWGTYCPRNFGNKYFGPVSLADALKNSLNTVAVQLLDKVGFDAVISTARSLGITRPLGRYYPLAIGAYEQTVLDMTAAYAAINNRGVYVPPTPFMSITGADGSVIWSRSSQGERGKRAVDSDTADAMLWMLQRVVSGGTGIAAKLEDRPVAGKTGTSEGARDLWFIGSIPQLTTAVWLGYDDNREQKGSSGDAAWAWKQYMIPVVKDMPVQQFPDKPELKRSFKAPAGAFLPPDEGDDPLAEPNAPPPVGGYVAPRPAPMPVQPQPRPRFVQPQAPRVIELAPGLEIIEPTVNPFE